jgi:radical SAM protein with 4Fe4S-binding SPASM domain
MNASRITLTGGEPFAHPQVIEFCEALVQSGMEVGICSNATLISEAQIVQLSQLGHVHINVSLDGFSPETHGRFRGDRGSFEVTRDTTIRLSAAALLQGILCTPNVFTTDADLIELLRFADRVGAKYFLLNPLSPYGRGIASHQSLGSSREQMISIHESLEREARTLGTAVELYATRFPNQEGLPLTACSPSDYVYFFANGNVTYCPYLSFAAAQNSDPRILAAVTIGNYKDGLSGDYSRPLNPETVLPESDKCPPCNLHEVCGRGCLAARLSSRQSLDPDPDVCSTFTQIR